jgi:nucleoid-associated protein YgaU
MVSTSSVDTYVVQPRDSLWSISKKPEIYGSATQWRRLFDANRDLLKGNPNGLRVGMTLQIPRGAAGSQTGSSEEDKGMTFKK